jgi:hypothetical protein
LFYVPKRYTQRQWRHFSLERFCSQEQETLDHDAGRRVLAAIPPPRAASGFRSYSQLWLSGQPPPCNLTAALFAIAQLSHAIAVERAAYSQRLWHSFLLDLSFLWRTHESHRDAYDCPDPASFSALTTSMPCMNPHPRARTICVFRHQPAFRAFSNLDRAPSTRRTSDFLHTFPARPPQASSRPTSSHPRAWSPNSLSRCNPIQIP